MVRPPLPAADLDHVLAHTASLWPALAGERLFITGGTGFFGTWLLESIVHARQQLQLDIRATVLSRTPELFLARHPHLAGQEALDWWRGDIRDFGFPGQAHRHIIHAATETYVREQPEAPLTSFDAIVQGTRRVLDFALHTGARQVLLTSSGAIYGPQPLDRIHVPEQHPGAPDCADPSAVYGEGKRTAELLCALYHQQHGLDVKIARCFAFVGPQLPLDKHFAIGNFMNDVLQGRDIAIQGDGTPLRSYLHAADLVIWLLTILLRGAPLRPYNVGSDQALSIADLAQQVATSLPGRERRVSIARTPEPGRPPARYVPDVARARSELGLEVRIPLADAIQRTLAWHLREVPAEPPYGKDQ